MPHVVTEPCIGTKDKACVGVCPVDCFYELEDQVVINPDECIDCGACIDVCPVVAIYPDDQVPEKWSSYTQKNVDAFANGTPPKA